MKKTTMLMMLAAVTMLVTVPASAQLAKPKKDKTIVAKGVYSGSLSGYINLNGKSFVIDDKTSIYQAGAKRGRQARGLYISNTYLIVSGTKRGDQLVARTIIAGAKPTGAQLGENDLIKSRMSERKN